MTPFVKQAVTRNCSRQILSLANPDFVFTKGVIRLKTFHLLSLVMMMIQLLCAMWNLFYDQWEIPHDIGVEDSFVDDLVLLF